MATVSQFTATPKIDSAQVTTANTNRDGTGTIVAVVTGVASPNFVKVEQVIIKAIVTTTAGMIRFFLSADGGTTKRLIHEVLVSAITASATVAAFEDVWYCPDDLVLPDANHILYAATEKTETFNVVALSAKF